VTVSPTVDLAERSKALVSGFRVPARENY